MMLPVRATLAAVAFLSALGHGQAAAQGTSGAGLLVSARWVRDHVHDKDLVILETGANGAYSAGHIAGARSIAVMDVVAHPPADSDAKVLPWPALRQLLERNGISSQSRVVVVSDSGWLSAGTRLMLTLQYAGLGQRSALLDGGMAAWRKAGYPVTTDVPPDPSPGRMSGAPPTGELIVPRDYVAAHAHSPRVKLIDAREAPCFTACGREAGHIPGAASIPMNTLVDDSGFFRSKGDLENIFRAAGVQAGDTVVAYCHNGYMSTAVVFAARLLGHPVRNYDGSFRDWRVHDLPTEGGAPPDGHR
jgi:thiosulfate/3-mercaptopyruvate sulfurtransferase